jgi:hypothetical protein
MYLQDAIHEAAEEVQKEKDVVANNIQEVVQPDIAKNVDHMENVHIPEIQQVFQKKEEFHYAVRNIGM